MTRNLHELYKIVKRRGTDIAALKSLISSGSAAKMQLAEELGVKVDGREAARVRNEEKKMAVLEQFAVEDKELKK